MLECIEEKRDNNLWIDLKQIRFVRIKNPDDAAKLLDLMKRAMMFYAQEAQLPLYRKDGTYYLSALNESRGDVIQAIRQEDFLAFQYHGSFIASARLVTDYKEKKSLLTRFSVDPKLHRSNVSEFFLDTLITYARNQGIDELYLYVAQENKRLMELLRSRNFLLYSVNSGRPYSKVCLIKTLRRGLP